MSDVQTEPLGTRTYAVLTDPDSRKSRQVTVHATDEQIIHGLATLFPVTIRGRPVLTKARPQAPSTPLVAAS